MKPRPFLLHALSPLHAGTGQAADVIDLPIARMRATGLPFVPGSSIKGVLRDARENGADPLAGSEALAVFGPRPEASDSDGEGQAEASRHAGALVVGDARLLALPGRSFKGTFAWVTSPMLLGLAARDLQELGGFEIPRLERSPGAAVASPEDSLVVHDSQHVYLEDLDLPVTTGGAAVGLWGDELARLVVEAADQRPMFTRRFVIVDDETMTFLWDTATQVDTRIRIDGDTRTVAPGQLWTEESLPPETLLIGLLAAERSRYRPVDWTPEQVLDAALPEPEILQFGGKATIGRGRCRIVPVTDVAGGVA